MSGRLAGIVDDIDDTIRQIRSSIFELNDPADIDGRSLRATVLKIVTEVEPVLGFRATVSFDGPVDTMVDDDLLRDAEAALREGLTNIGKHAAATAAAIRIVLTRDDLRSKSATTGPKHRNRPDAVASPTWPIAHTSAAAAWIFITTRKARSCDGQPN